MMSEILSEKGMAAAKATAAGREIPSHTFVHQHGISYIKGNMFEHLPQRFLVIPHVCNDLGAWGSGFVIPLAQQFPEAKARYLRAFTRSAKDRAMAQIELGWTQIVECRVGVWVCNMVAQHGVGSDENGRPPLRYSVLAHCMESVAVLALAEQAEIHAPKFGAGLAGGNWDFIAQLIREIWVDRGLKVMIYHLD